MTEHVDRAYHAVAIFVVLNITGSLSDYLPPASNNNAGAKCSFLSSGFGDLGVQDPIWVMAHPFTEAAIGFLCMHDEGTEKSSEDLTTYHDAHQKHFFPPLLFLFALFNWFKWKWKPSFFVLNRKQEAGTSVLQLQHLSCQSHHISVSSIKIAGVPSDFYF